jgi:hypothetical protein
MQMTKELLQQIINSNFKGWLLAGYPKEFKTWQMSTRAVRHILLPAIDFGLHWDFENKSVQFKGVGENEHLTFTFKFCDSVD